VVDLGALEREVKLEVGVGFRIPDLDGIMPGITARPQPEQHLQAVYVDTPDLRLARSGLTLRHRSERAAGGSPGEWTLKLPEQSSEPGLSRREINWPGRWGPIPPEIAGLVRAYRRSAVLSPVARLVTHRRRTILCGRLGEPLLEIDDDVVSVMDGRRLAARFREVEVEVVGAVPPPLLEAVVARLEGAGAVSGDPRSKLARAIGVRAAEPPDVVPVPIGRAAPMADVIRAAIAHGYLRLVAHDLGVRLDEDPEDVHQARVATRRLRSDLRTFRTFLPEDWVAEIRAELGWVAEALGGARDADVMLGRLQAEVEGLDPGDAGAAAALLGRLVARRDEAREQLMVVFDSERYGALLDRLVVATRELPPMKVPTTEDQPVAAGSEIGGPDAGGPNAGGPDAGGPEAADHVAPPVVPAPVPAPGPDRDAPARQMAPTVVSGPWRHLRRAVAALGPVPADDALHDVRIHAKRLRYACEAVVGVAGKPAAALARAAAELQGVLGDFHDAIVAEEWLRAASVDAPAPLALVAGQLIARQRQDAEHCRAVWGDSWKPLSRKKLRAWLT
jgi:CHAD domain-containing protein